MSSLASHRSEAPTGVDPTAQIWGYMGSDMRESDEGVFLWFKSLEEMLSVVSVPDRGLLEPAEPEDAAVLLEKLRILTFAAPPFERSTRDVRSEFEVVDRGRFMLRWWGPFSEICAGPTDWESELRRSFRFSTGSIGSRGGDPTGPITGPERSEFMDFLLGYGL